MHATAEAFKAQHSGSSGTGVSNSTAEVPHSVNHSSQKLCVAPSYLNMFLSCGLQDASTCMRHQQSFLLCCALQRCAFAHCSRKCMPRWLRQLLAGVAMARQLAPCDALLVARLYQRVHLGDVYNRPPAHGTYNRSSSKVYRLLDACGPSW